MKKVLFLMRYPLDDAYNLKLKFLGQMHACVNIGYDVYYIGYDANHYFICSMNDGSKKRIANTHFYNKKSYRSTIAFFDLYSALAKVLDDEMFDCIYMRKKMVTAKAVTLLEKYKKKGGKLIVEIPTFGVEETSLGFTRSIAKRLLNKSAHHFDEIVDLYTLIGNNCPDKYKNTPAMEIVNGVSLDTLPMKKQSMINLEIHMVALASMRDWQGFDRIIEGISKYRGKEKLYLHLVGQDFDGSVQKWMEKARELKVESYVINHGPLYEEQLTNVFDICHMAVGALGLHRRGGIVGSTLKVREYTVRGIPFIYAYNDSALDGTEWFTLRFKSDESWIDFDLVVPWIKNIYTRKGFINEIRQFASDHMSWEIQFKPVFNQILEE